MNDFLNQFNEIEDTINTNARLFIDTVQRRGITWGLYELQENMLNKYYYSVHELLGKYKPNLLLLLESQDPEKRRISLKLIKDGFIDLSYNNAFIKKLIYISIIGNDEEKNISRNIIVVRKCILNVDGLIENILSSLYGNEINYYLYKDIGEFLSLIENDSLLKKHIEKGMNSQDNDIIELANDFSSK